MTAAVDPRPFSSAAIIQCKNINTTTIHQEEVASLFSVVSSPSVRSTSSSFFAKPAKKYPPPNVFHQDAEKALLEYAKQVNELQSFIASADSSTSTTTTIPYTNGIQHSKESHHEETSSSAVVFSTPSDMMRKEEGGGRRAHYRSDSLISWFPNLSQEEFNTLIAVDGVQPPKGIDRRPRFDGDQQEEDHDDDEDSFIWS